MSADALFQAALTLYQQGRLEHARQLCGQLAARHPRHYQGRQLLGVLTVQTGELQAGLAHLREAVALAPTQADGYLTLANCLLQARQPADAVPYFEMATRLGAARAEHLNSWGVALRDAGRAEEALAVFDRAVAGQPDYARAHNNRGNALRDLGRLDGALLAYEKAVQLDPQNLLARNNHAQLLATLGHDAQAQETAVDILTEGDRALVAADVERALQLYDQQLRATPDDPEALNRRGVALLTLRRLDEAQATFDHLLRIAPDDAAARNNAGKACLESHRYEDALAHYARATEVAEGNASFWMYRSQVQMMMGLAEESLPCLDRVLALDATHPYALGARLTAQRTVCDWQGLTERIDAVAQAVQRQDVVVTPFQWLANSDDPASHLACAGRHHTERHAAISASSTPLWRQAPRVAPPGRIRLAYLSADLHNHATAHLMAELFERHDRSRFEVRAYSFGPPREDAMRQRLRRGFDHFEDVQHLSDEAIARRLAEDGVHIAIDLKGYTHLGRSGILAWRPAPVQVSYLGYPGTLGTDFIDYVIADPHVLPPGEEQHYSEQVVRLPECYQVNDRQRPVAAQVPSRTALGLPEEAFVFCCFNNGYKLGPEMFAVWMRLLHQVPGSVLWLLADHAAQPRHLRTAAQAHGINGARLVFAERLPQAEHLARHARADLFLDTLPYNAHTTASDALWAGLPVLTCRGRTFAARVAASLLHAAGLPELVTHSLDDYHALALRLAREPQGQLAALRQRLRASRDTCALFDTPRFTRHLEAAYQAMWLRHAQGLAPSAFKVPTGDITPASGS